MVEIFRNHVIQPNQQHHYCKLRKVQMKITPTPLIIMVPESDGSASLAHGMNP